MQYSHLFMHAKTFLFLEFYSRNNYKRENNIINAHVPITQLQLLSTFGCSCFICSPKSFKANHTQHFTLTYFPMYL